MSLSIELTKPQAELFSSEAKYPLFIGGFGCGKTETLILNAIRDLIDFKGANIALYSPTYDLMRLNLMPRMEVYLKAMFGRIGINKSNFIFHVPGYGKIIFRSLDNPGRIIAYEVFRSHVDEIDTLPYLKAEEAWNKIIARNRQKHSSGAPNRVSAYTTPEGFKFTYHRWEKNKVDGYAYVRAPTYSNPHLPDDYVDSLRTTYPASLIEAYIEGIWVNLTQGACFPDFDREANGCKTVIVAGDPLYVGQDFNVTKQASVIYKKIQYVHPITHQAVEELHAVDEIPKAFDTPQTIQILKKRYEKHPITMMPDASGKSRSTNDASKSDFTLFREARFKIDAPAGNPPVRDRLNAANALICNGEGVRRYKVNVEACPELVSAIEQITFTDNGSMDKAHDLDHIIDAGTYPVHRMYPVERRSASTISIIGGY